MSFDPKVENLISVYARELETLLGALLPKSPNEATLRLRVEPLLHRFCSEAGVEAEAHDEYVVAGGKIADAVFDRLIVEFKRPGILSSPRTRSEAIEQLKKYMEGLAQKEQRKRLAGVVFDGKELAFMRYRAGHITVEAPRPADRAALEKLLHWLAGLSSGTALTAENLARDFSIDQPRTRTAIGTLYQALTTSLLTEPEGMVAKLFEQWRLFFSEAIDYKEAFGDRKLEPLKKWLAKAGIAVDTPEEAERFFFALHTYFALLVKLIAWLALSRHLGPKVGIPLFASLETLPSGELWEKFREMERGGIFRAYGIENLLEGDFFAWYLYGWNEQVEQAIRGLISQLAQYDVATLSIDPDETRDLLKKLYHYLLPREIRHNLGEYYTPDWLAQRLLEQVDHEFFSDHEATVGRQQRRIFSLRWLDPACGSGTFLVLLIKRYRELGERLMIPEEELLEAILRNVVGFDINPLAVITARVNYLLALGDLLEYLKAPITIPVYLADSVLLPELEKEMGTLETSPSFKIRTAVDVFRVPQVVFGKERFPKFCSLIEKALEKGLPPEAFPGWLAGKIPLTEEELELAWSQLQGIYKRIHGLHCDGLDGLWARLLKNNFAPLTVGQFDYVVGNPPWVNWENLPDGYRDDTKSLWARYGLFPHRSMDVILGKGKKDIAMLMTYVAMDRFLKPGGKLGFVITQSLFKTSGAGQGFRRFKLGENGPSLRVMHVDDMVALNPFEGASNRTAVMIIMKGQRTHYPVPYTVWRKKGRARFTYDSTLEEVKAATRTLKLFAEPVDLEDPTSPWLTATKPALRAVRKVLGKSDYTAHEGVNTGGANAVYWVEIVSQRPDSLVVVRNITKGAKREVSEVTAVIEPDLLYPLLRGRDVKRWRAEPSAHILMVQDPKTRRGIPEEELQECFPHTWEYLKRFESILRERKSRGVSDMLKKGAPFYTMFAVGDYTFAPWKVVWPWIAKGLRAAVVDVVHDKPVIPEHNTFLVACDDPDEAFYICALMNSCAGDLAIRSFFSTGGGGIGSPIVLEHIRIPKYDPADPVHRALAEASKEAHEAAARGVDARLREIEERVDALAAQLWGLTDKELSEIYKSLEELGGELNYQARKTS